MHEYDFFCQLCMYIIVLLYVLHMFCRYSNVHDSYLYLSSQATPLFKACMIHVSVFFLRNKQSEQLISHNIYVHFSFFFSGLTIGYLKVGCGVLFGENN